MKKPWLLALLALVVAGLSVLFIVAFRISRLWRNLPSEVEAAMYVALALIVAAMCTAIVLAWRPGRVRSFVVALLAMPVAGGLPFAADATHRTIEARQQSAERAAFEAQFLSRLESYLKDVAGRISARKPFSPREAQNFVEFVQGSDLNHRRLQDHSPAAFALLKQAIDGKILDPNARVKGPRAVDVSEEPLFVAYYKFYLQSGATMPQKRVREREWTLFQMLIAGGADLDDPAAAVLRDVVKLEAAPYEVEGWVQLK